MKMITDALKHSETNKALSLISRQRKPSSHDHAREYELRSEKCCWEFISSKNHQGVELYWGSSSTYVYLRKLNESFWTKPFSIFQYQTTKGFLIRRMAKLQGFCGKSLLEKLEEVKFPCSDWGRFWCREIWISRSNPNSRELWIINMLYTL